MGEKTIIAWTDHSYNIAWGCVKVSPGCDHCYAERNSARYGHGVWGKNAPRRTFGAEHWREPLKWNKQAEAEGRIHLVFCSSMCDIFENHPTIDQEREKLWPLIRQTPNLHWQLLTKRAERIKRHLPKDWGEHGYPNVWLGVSVENQQYAELRIPYLLSVPARVHFLSVEPLLEALDLSAWLKQRKVCKKCFSHCFLDDQIRKDGTDKGNKITSSVECPGAHWFPAVSDGSFMVPAHGSATKSSAKPIDSRTSRTVNCDAPARGSSESVSLPNSPFTVEETRSIRQFSRILWNGYCRGVEQRSGRTFGHSVCIEDALDRSKTDTKSSSNLQHGSASPINVDDSSLDNHGCLHVDNFTTGISWCIVGGESGPKFREMKVEWARSMRQQCKLAGIAFFHKQSSGYQTEMGIELDGEIVREYPISLDLELRRRLF